MRGPLATFLGRLGATKIFNPVGLSHTNFSIMFFQSCGFVDVLMRLREIVRRHGSIFYACTVITQLAIVNGEPLFEVEYRD
jgi:hypothetical protein